MKKMLHNHLSIVLLFAVSAIIVFIFIYSSAMRELTTLENLMFQVIVLATSISGSVVLGRKLEQKEVGEIIKPYARPAFRKVMYLYGGLSRVAKEIQKGLDRPDDNSNNTLVVLKALVYEQICTVDDAMEDWRDIIPEDVEELEKRRPKSH